MARSKQYNEQEVIEKAMSLFWRNGYENTSVRMLEKEMGINQFSIYASFGNKQGVFLESIRTYRKRIKIITDRLEKSNNGIFGIKQFFYDFIEFSTSDNCKKGCLVTNTVSELGENGEPEIMAEVEKFFEEVKSLFKNSLQQDSNKSEEAVIKQVNYLAVSMLGLSSASKILDDQQLQDYIEIAFLRL
jgi:TetR/AcrR family transcriptional repressor of nem operon